jgi:hypothetical protein
MLWPRKYPARVVAQPQKANVTPTDCTVNWRSACTPIRPPATAPTKEVALATEDMRPDGSAKNSMVDTTIRAKAGAAETLALERIARPTWSSVF